MATISRHFMVVLLAAAVLGLLGLGAAVGPRAFAHLLGWDELRESVMAHYDVVRVRAARSIGWPRPAEGMREGPGDEIAHLVARWQRELRRAWKLPPDQRLHLRVLEEPPDCPSHLCVQLVRFSELFDHGHTRRDTLLWPAAAVGVASLPFLPGPDGGLPENGRPELESLPVDVQWLLFLEGLGWYALSQVDSERFEAGRPLPSNLVPPQESPTCIQVRQLAAIWRLISELDAGGRDRSKSDTGDDCGYLDSDGQIWIGGSPVPSGFGLLWLRAAQALHKALHARPSSGKPRARLSSPDALASPSEKLPPVTWPAFGRHVDWNGQDHAAPDAGPKSALLAFLLLLGTAEIARTSLLWALLTGVLIRLGRRLVRRGYAAELQRVDMVVLGLLAFASAVAVRTAVHPSVALHMALCLPLPPVSSDIPFGIAWLAGRKYVAPGAWAVFGLALLVTVLWFWRQRMGPIRALAVVSSAGLLQLASYAFCVLPFGIPVHVPGSHLMLLQALVPPGVQIDGGPVVRVLEYAAALHALFWFATCCPIFWFALWLPLCLVGGSTGPAASAGSRGAWQHLLPKRGGLHLLVALYGWYWLCLLLFWWLYYGAV